MLTDELKSTRVVGALEACPGAITGGTLALGEITLEIDPARIVEVCRFLKTQDQFSRVSTVTAVDRYPMEPRFEVIYHLHSIPRNERLRLKCRVSGSSPQIDSVCEVWRGADWYEREVFDLFGISFRNHPNLKRILMPDDWEGHPLRKDYPVHGFKYSYPQE